MKKITVTVAISAYNEEENIINFLKSVLRQKEKGFTLKEIWVHSDGSKDKTVQIAKSLRSKKIKIFAFSKRIGKSSRLNQVYKNLTTDILVQSDADVIFAHKYVIRDLIKPLLNSTRIWMCGGHPEPLPAKSFIGKSVNVTFNVYSKLRTQFNGGNNCFSADGRLLAFKKELVKKITIPPDMICNDRFTYYCCINFGHKYKYVPTARVNFQSPETLKDHIKQNSRFEAAELRMLRYFPKELVQKESRIPKYLFIKNALVQFLEYPIHSLFILIVNQYCRLLARKTESKQTALWFMARTTKSLGVNI